MTRSSREAMRAPVEARITSLLERGDLRAAATEIVAEYGPTYLAHLLQLLRDDDAAREAFAQFNLDLWNGIAAFHRRCPAFNWGYRLAHNAAIRYLRHPYRLRRVAATSELFEQLKARSLTSILDAEKGDAGQLIARFRAQLTADEQTLLTLRIHEELEHEAIADLMGLSSAAVARKRWERLVQKLAKLAAEFEVPAISE